MSIHAHAVRRSAPPLRVVRPPGRPQPVRRPRGVPNAVIGTLFFLGAEAMLFAGLISAFLVLRASVEIWPPPGQPRLPVAVTAVNTVLLLISGYTMQRALAAVRRDERAALSRWLGITAALGTVFLLVQGTEWVRLLHYGLRVSSGVYGSTFYTLVGWHAVHVLVGVILLLVAQRGALSDRYSAARHGAIDACRLYWSFVVGVWPILYLTVYLA